MWFLGRMAEGPLGVGDEEDEQDEQEDERESKGKRDTRWMTVIRVRSR